MKLKPDYLLSTTFLTWLRPRGPWTLCAIKPDTKGAIPTATFINQEELAKAREWIEEHNKAAGVYFCINPTRRRVRKKPSEEEMLAFQYSALDLDPDADETPEQCQKRVLAKLAKSKLKPTLIWSSGNGIQCAFWIKPAVLLKDRRTLLRCKAGNKGMVQLLGGDTVQSLDHVFRLPGTINWPNAGKIAKGRAPVVSGNVIRNPNVSYSLADLPKPTKTAAPPPLGLVEPPGGWDLPGHIARAVIHCQNTKTIAAEGVSGTGLRTALCMRDWGLSPEMAFDVMWEYWVPRCDYPWEPDELEGKIKRAYHVAENDPGCRTFAYRVEQASRDFTETES